MSDYVYHFDAIRCDDSTVIALRYIESMKLGECDESDLVVNKLKDDLYLKIRTISGKEYNISMKSTLKHLNIVVHTKEQVRTAIYNKWSALIR